MVEIELDFTDEEFMTLALYAHENDITLNKAVEKILTIQIEKWKTEDNN